jgi:hypothetical protein
MIKRRSAVFTIVKNEAFFLPIWLKHYQKYFDNCDIYVLNHESTDGCVMGLDVNVIDVFNPIVFDHRWLLETVQNMQRSLLKKYECVLFAESDEIIYSTDVPLSRYIDDFLKDTSCQYKRTTGYEVKHNVESEPTLTSNTKILTNRNEWFRYDGYDKTLLSKVPLNWNLGFHHLAGNNPPREESLFLLHLHRLDCEEMVKRHNYRLTNCVIRDDGAGGHNRLTDRAKLLDYFNQIPSPLEKIPLAHKQCLSHL